MQNHFLCADTDAFWGTYHVDKRATDADIKKRAVIRRVISGDNFPSVSKDSQALQGGDVKSQVDSGCTAGLICSACRELVKCFCKKGCKKRYSCKIEGPVCTDLCNCLCYK